MVQGRVASDLAEILRSAPKSRATDSVAAELCHGRQTLLCLHRAKRKDGARACRARRLPGESHLGSKIHHRSDNGGALDERDAWPGTTDRPDAALQNPKAYARWSTSWVPNDRAR